jgi:hypothetical protein
MARQRFDHHSAPVTRLRLPYLAFQLGRQRSLSRSGRVLLVGALGRMAGAGPNYQGYVSRGHRLPASGGRDGFIAAVDQAHVNCRCVLVGLDATEFAAQSLRSAHLRLRAGGSRSWRCFDSGSTVQCSRRRATRMTQIGDARRPADSRYSRGQSHSPEPMLSADNSKAMHQKKATARR